MGAAIREIDRDRAERRSARERAAIGRVLEQQVAGAVDLEEVVPIRGGILRHEIAGRDQRSLRPVGKRARTRISMLPGTLFAGVSGVEA